ncbi:MAG: NUDIX hydrolase [Coriobacteriia bacterium]|nr:NUDIX hydrolase [Coriobacteriia bacterium]
MPRVRVAALLLLGDSIVTVRHRRGNATYHLLPGGGVDWGEPLAQALMREVAEETGLTCAVGRPIVVNDTIAPDGSRHIVNITFECSVTGGAITKQPLDPRVEAVELVAPSDITSLDLRPPIASHLLAALDCVTSREAIYVASLYTPDA